MRKRWWGNMTRVYRSTPLDRSWSSSRVVAVLGPLEGLTAAEVQSRLSTIVTNSKRPRLAIAPSRSQARWPYRPDLIGDAVHVVSDTAPIDLGEFLTEIGHRQGQRHPTDVFLCGNYLAVEYPHAVGDGHYGLSLVGALAAGIPALSPDLPRSVVWRALWRHYGRRPGLLGSLWTLRKDQRRKTSGTAKTRAVGDWRSSRRVATRRFDARQLGQLQDWIDEHAPGATRAAVMSALWLAALRSVRLSVDEHVVVLFNCRRYLPREYQAALGNFAIGIPLRIGMLPPAEITVQLRKVTETGWPIMSIGIGALRSWLSRFTRTMAKDPDVVTDRIRLSVSDMGRLPFDHLPWVHDAPSVATAFVDLDRPDAMTLLISDTADGRHVSATYCAAMVPRDAVEAALDRMCSEPTELLSAAAIDCWASETNHTDRRPGS